MEMSTGLLLHNRYRIEDLLGKGGMGAVYRAWDIHLDIPVAVKGNLDTSPEAQRQFSREARILARLSHPNLPRVTDHFFIEGQGQYLVMDYIEGDDLRSMVEKLGFLPESQVLTWISQICAALTYLHSQNPPIIHRDIKPANIKIRPDGRAMLVDFGIAKIYDSNLITTIGAQLVTPGFSPPEQYGSGKTDIRSDIYALGATLYNLLTGQTPAESVQRMVGHLSLPPPSNVNPQISLNVDQAVCKAMDVQTEYRFQNVHELHEALIRRPISKVEQIEATSVFDEVVSPATVPATVTSAVPLTVEASTQVHKELTPVTNIPPSTPVARHRLSRWWYLAGFALMVVALTVLSLQGLINRNPGVIANNTATSTVTTTGTFTPFPALLPTITPLPIFTQTPTVTASHSPTLKPTLVPTTIVPMTSTVQIVPSLTPTEKRPPTSTNKPQPTSTPRPTPTKTLVPPPVKTPTKTLVPPPMKTPTKTLAPPP